MEKRSFWDKYKIAIIGLVVVALIGLAFIPSEIPVPGRTLDDYERRDCDIASIEVVEKTNDGIFFRVSAKPNDFIAYATVVVDESVVVGSKGVIADSSGLVFDGSYKYKYDLIFPRDGNMLQTLLTMLGLFNFNPSYEGHVEGIVANY
jgi:hypothetical protein